MAVSFWEDLTREEIGNLRASRLSASRVGRIMSGSYRAWNTLAEELRNPKPYFSNTSIPALAWGLKHEEQGLAEWWERNPQYPRMATDVFTFWHEPDHDYDEWVGATPDALMLDLLGNIIIGREQKCPYNQLIHEAYVDAAELPDDYRAQVQYQMLVSDQSEWSFGSFDPRRNGRYRSVDVLVKRDEEYLADMSGKVVRFVEGMMVGETFSAPQITAQNLEDAL